MDSSKSSTTSSDPAPGRSAHGREIVASAWPTQRPAVRQLCLRPAKWMLWAGEQAAAAACSRRTSAKALARGPPTSLQIDCSSTREYTCGHFQHTSQATHVIMKAYTHCVAPTHKRETRMGSKTSIVAQYAQSRRRPHPSPRRQPGKKWVFRCHPSVARLQAQLAARLGQLNACRRADSAAVAVQDERQQQ